MLCVLTTLEKGDISVITCPKKWTGYIQECLLLTLNRTKSYTGLSNNPLKNRSQQKQYMVYMRERTNDPLY
jgi:hypothetical protein